MIWQWVKNKKWNIKVIHKSLLIFHMLIKLSPIFLISIKILNYLGKLIMLLINNKQKLVNVTPNHKMIFKLVEWVLEIYMLLLHKIKMDLFLYNPYFRVKILGVISMEILSLKKLRLWTMIGLLLELIICLLYSYPMASQGIKKLMLQLLIGSMLKINYIWGNSYWRSKLWKKYKRKLNYKLKKF